MHFETRRSTIILCRSCRLHPGFPDEVGNWGAVSSHLLAGHFVQNDETRYGAGVGDPKGETATAMATYVVFIRESLRDPAEMETYSQLASDTLEGHPVKVLAAYGPHEVLEGPKVEGVVILEFPSIEEAKSWYDSAAYQDAREHRFKGADYRAVIVEGLSPWEAREAVT